MSLCLLRYPRFANYNNSQSSFPQPNSSRSLLFFLAPRYNCPSRPSHSSVNKAFALSLPDVFATSSPPSTPAAHSVVTHTSSSTMPMENVVVACGTDIAPHTTKRNFAVERRPSHRPTEATHLYYHALWDARPSSCPRDARRNGGDFVQFASISSGARIDTMSRCI